MTKGLSVVSQTSLKAKQRGSSRSEGVHDVRMRTVFLATLMILSPTVGSAAQSRSVVEHLPTTTLSGKTVPFAAAVRVENILYMSGQIGVGADDKLPPGFDVQARNSLDRITLILKREGLVWKDVFHCTVLLSDMSNWPAFNTIYAAYVDPANLPARSALGANGLALGALVEVQCEAYDPPK